MKAKRNFLLKAIRMLFILSICLNYSCKKDADTPDIIVPPVDQRVTEIFGFKGGNEEFKDIYHYNGNQLSVYYVYRYDDKGDWKDWLRYSYEYPDNDLIVEKREGVSDSVWFLTNKYERYYSGDKLEEMIFYDYDEGYTGAWRPYRKLTWTFDQERIKEKLSYTYADASWSLRFKAIYEYTGNLWTAVTNLKYINESWDTVACTVLLYQEGRLSEVDVYEFDNECGWSLNEQYLIEYEGNRLSEMIINESAGDSLMWDRTFYVTYNEHGKPAMYTVDYICCPTEIMQMTYEEGRGNFYRATQELSNYILWPWFPSPGKNNE